MTDFGATQEWRLRWPGAVAGCLLVDSVANPERSPELEPLLEKQERALRARYDGFERAALRGLRPFDAYDRYYREFGQNYHVLHQVESVALKGKPIPRRAALVEAAFVEELTSGLLTALHDADTIGAQILVDVAAGDEVVTLYNGNDVTLKPGDMYMRDERSVLTSVILGPATYGRVRPETTRVAVCVYAPAGIGTSAVADHLEAIAANMRLVSPRATIQSLDVISA